MHNIIKTILPLLKSFVGSHLLFLKNKKWSGGKFVLYSIWLKFIPKIHWVVYRIICEFEPNLIIQMGPTPSCNRLLLAAPYFLKIEDDVRFG